MTVLFFVWHRKHKKNDLKVEIKIPGTVLFDFILFFNIAVEKIWKKQMYSSWNSRKRFFYAQNIQILGPNFRNLVNLVSFIFMLLDISKYPFLTYVNQKYKT